MSTITASPEIKKATQAEVLFMNSLESIFKSKDFKAQVYPEGEDSIKKAKVFLDEALTTSDFMEVIKLANKWNTSIKIAPSEIGIRILFQLK